MLVRRNRLTAGLLLLVGTIGLLSLGLGRVHRIRTVTTDADVAWNDDEVVLFAGTNQLGWSSSVLEFIREYAMSLLPGVFPSSPDVVRPTVTVTRYRKDGMVTTRLDREVFRHLTFIDQQLYLGRWRWMDGGLKLVNQPELQELYPRGGWSAANRGEWLFRCCLLTSGADLDVSIDSGGEQMNLRVTRSEWETVITLHKPDESVMTLFRTQTLLEDVSETEFEARFMESANSAQD